MSVARFKVKVCRGPTCGGERGSAQLRDRLEEIIAGANLGEYVELSWQSCFGRCSQAPNMLVRQLASADPEPSYSLAIMPKPKGRAALYSNLTEDDLVTIVREHILGGRIVRRLLSVKPKSARKSAEGKAEHRLPQVLTTVRGTSEGEP